MKTANRIALAVAVVAAAGLAFWALQPQPIEVQAASVTRGVFEQTVSDDGKTRVRDRFVVSAPLAGRVARIALKAGDPVQAGQTLAELTPTAPAFLDARAERELRARIGAAEALQMRAKADVGKTEAQLAQARADRDRSGKLATQGFLAPTAREQGELAVRTAERSLEAAQFAEHSAAHEVEQARAALIRYRAESEGKVAQGAKWEVRSPVAGSVLRVVQENEGAVALGAPLVELADPRSLEVIVDVLSQDAVGIRPGMPARLELGPGIAPLGARVRRVEPAAFTKTSALGIEEQRVNVVMDFTESLAQIQTVGDGYRVEAGIVVFRVDQAIMVPVGALFRDADGWAVFVIDGGRAVKRRLVSARRNGMVALVESGVEPGEPVVVYPPDALRDGVKVAVRVGREEGK